MSARTSCLHEANEMKFDMNNTLMINTFDEQYKESRVDASVTHRTSEVRLSHRILIGAHECMMIQLRSRSVFIQEATDRVGRF